MSLISVSAPDTYELRSQLRDIRKTLDKFFRKLLQECNEEHVYECDIEIEYGYFGLSSLELPHVKSIWLDPLGLVWFEIDSHAFEFNDVELEILCDIVDGLSF